MTNDDFFHRSDNGTDPDEENFEQYLTEKTAAISQPSQLNEIAAVDEVEFPPPAQTTQEHAEKLEVLGVEGHKYVKTTTEPFNIDAKWLQARNDARNLAVTEMNSEQIIERYHGLAELIYLTQAQQLGLRDALEELLRAESDARRAELMVMDRLYKTKMTKKSQGQASPKRKTSSTPAKTHNKKQFKAIDTLHGLGFDKPAIEAKLKEAGKFNDETKAYLDSLFS